MEILIIIGIIVLIGGACSGNKSTKNASNYQLGKIAAQLGEEIGRNLFR